MEKRKKIRVAVWHGKQEMQIVRARVSWTGNKVVLTIQPLELWAPYKARWAWAAYKAPLKPGDCLPLVAQNLVPEKGAGKKAIGKRVKKQASVSFSSASATRSRGGRGGGERC